MKEFFEEIEARGGPRISLADKDGGAAELQRDLTGRGHIVTHTIEGETHHVTVNEATALGHKLNGQGDTALAAYASLWLGMAEVNGWGTQEAETLRLERKIAGLQSEISTLRNDMWTLCVAAADVASELSRAARNPRIYQEHVRTLADRAKQAEERHKLRR